jgi:hypothetical protein
MVPAGSRRCSLFVTVKWDGSRLSITGVEGPNRNGNAVGGCGQVGISRNIVPAKGWTPSMVRALRSAWDRWHLNDMNAGTPAQMEHLRTHGGPMEYGVACDTLKAAGLLTVPDPRDPSKPYTYGQAWLTEPVPEDVLSMLASLPPSPKPHPWGDK